jgi:hypothetical protein
MVLSSAIYTESCGWFCLRTKSVMLDQLRPYMRELVSIRCVAEKEVYTSKNPLMKLFGSLALGSSSARKYLRTCDSCFQKLSVSCPYVNICTSNRKPCSVLLPYLELLVTVEQQHIHRLELIHVSMPLELLPHLRPKCRYGHVERVHGLHLGSLYSSSQHLAHGSVCCPLPRVSMAPSLPHIPSIQPS